MAYNSKGLNQREYLGFKETTYTQVSATLTGTGQNIAAYPALLGEIFCSSTTALTLAVYDKASQGTSTDVIVNTFTPAAATAYIFNVSTKTGLTIVSTGTGQYTVTWKTTESV